MFEKNILVYIYPLSIFIDNKNSSIDIYVERLICTTIGNTQPHSCRAIFIENKKILKLTRSYEYEIYLGVALFETNCEDLNNHEKKNVSDITAVNNKHYVLDLFIIIWVDDKH